MFQTPFMVVEGEHDCLLGFQSAIELGIISVNSVNSVRTDTRLQMSTDELVGKFLRIFSGELGCPANVVVKLEIDPSVKPVRQPQRPVPFHLRDAVSEEILKQVDQGILERVENNSGPTPWIANLVLVPKERSVSSSNPNWQTAATGEPHKPEIRITCDSRALNKAILRVRHPGKTIDDIGYQANGSTKFSKVDITKAFHQFLLAEESRNLTTITTHLGLF